MAGGIYKGKRRCSEVTATIGFTLCHMRCKFFFLGSWSAQNDSKWKHSHHVCVHYMLFSDTRVTCVLWGISHALIKHANRIKVNFNMWYSLHHVITNIVLNFLFSRKQKKGVPKVINHWLLRQCNSHNHILSFSCGWVHTWDPWTGLRLHSILKYVLWCVFDPSTGSACGWNGRGMTGVRTCRLRWMPWTPKSLRWCNGGRTTISDSAGANSGTWRGQSRWQKLGADPGRRTGMGPGTEGGTDNIHWSDSLHMLMFCLVHHTKKQNYKINIITLKLLLIPFIICLLISIMGALIWV